MTLAILHFLFSPLPPLLACLLHPLSLSHHRYMYYKYTDSRRLKKLSYWSYNKVNAEEVKLIHRCVWLILSARQSLESPRRLASIHG